MKFGLRVSFVLMIALASALVISHALGQPQEGGRTVVLGGPDPTLSVIATNAPSQPSFLIDCVVGHPQHLQAIDPETGTILYAVKVGIGLPLYGCANSATLDERTGAVLVITGQDSNFGLPSIARIRLLNSRSGQTIATLPASAPVALAVNTQQGVALVANEDHAGTGTIDVLNIRTGTPITTVPVAMFPQHLVVDERLNRAFVFGPFPVGQGGVGILDAISGRVLHTVIVPGRPVAIAIDEKRGHLFVAAPSVATPAATGYVSMIDIQTGRVLYTTPLRQGPTALVADARTGEVFVALSAGNTVKVLAVRSGAIKRSIVVGSHPVALALDERARRLLVVSQGISNTTGEWLGSGTVDVVDVSRGTVKHVIPVGVAPIAISIDPAHRGRAIVVNAGGRIRPSTGQSMPNWMPQILPWLPLRTATAPESVSLLDHAY